MAVLSKIRQRSLFLIVIIAIALFSFVLADLIKNNDSFASKEMNVVATINGVDITREDFLAKVDIAQKQSGPNSSASQIMNMVWDQELRATIVQSQSDILGLTIEKDQLRDLIKTAMASSPEFQNESGQFDENKLNEFVANLKDIAPKPGILNGRPITYSDWLNYEDQLTKNALQQNYFNLVKAGLIGTLAEGKLEHRLQSENVDFKYVQIPYSKISDKSVKVSDEEIKAYISKNEKKYKVEASRDIRFVEFKEVATAEDEKAIKSELTKLLQDRVEYNEVTKGSDSVPGFLKTTDNESFVNSNSDIKFNKQFVFKSSLPSMVADSVFKLNIGQIYGPYNDGGFYKISKVVAAKQVPDSAKVRHILIPFIGAQGALPEVKQTEKQAKATADSLLVVLKKDLSKFPEFVKKYSADKGSVSNQGRYDWHPYNSMVQEFNDFEFEGKVGDIGVVKTVYGFHILEIEGQKEKERALQIATLARKIEPSDETIDKVFRDASNFEVSINKDNFEAVAKRKGFEVRPVNSLKELDENIPGVGSQRQIVRWAFEEGLEVGDTKRFNIPNGYLIAQLVAAHEKGLMSVKEARPLVETIVRNQKKAQIIIKNTSGKTLEAVSKSKNVPVMEAMAINKKAPFIPAAGREPYVIGYAFGLKKGKTSGLLEGETGVFMIQVTKVTPAVKLDNYQATANQVEQQKVSVVSSKLFEALKEASEIEDNRAKIQIQ